QLGRRLAALGRNAADMVRAEHQRQTVGHASIGNSITSLRLIATIDWNHAVENVSLMEQVLRRDPASVYPRMDFASRDRYRQAVEELAAQTGEAQLETALRAIDCARAAVQRDPNDPRGSHVGHYL